MYFEPSWETMYTFETAQFHLTWQIRDHDDVDFSFDETGEVRAKVYSGEWRAFESRIAVYHKQSGMLFGEATLGGSIYENPKDFRDHIGCRGKYGSYFRGMVSEAVAEARKTLASLQNVQLRGTK
jgi:hypothetical protein